MLPYPSCWMNSWYKLLKILLFKHLCCCDSHVFSSDKLFINSSQYERGEFKQPVEAIESPKNDKGFQTARLVSTVP